MEGIKRPLTAYGHGRDASRARELARIHCLVKERGFDRATYEALLYDVAGVTSAATLTAADRQRVIARLDARQRVVPGQAPGNLAGKPMLRKIAALLADGGYSWAYADALAKRLTRCERLQFASDAGLRKVIAALVYDQKRRARVAQGG